MNPREYYRKLAFSIKDAEIRMVAAVMAEHIGEENAVRLDALCGRVGMDERKVQPTLIELPEVKSDYYYNWYMGA